MPCYKDKSFCSSPGCINKCGRKLSELDTNIVYDKDLLVCYADFCDKNGEIICND